ncbi:GDSL-like lipase/acylhydrolase family protein [Sphingobacterium allocomposti]|uniref:GDSL-like lipase/acylhydrolase family protein n=1 Tax=Sphingobacterium allocomposti TaxID=415956 RepID=A0A5S5DL07_9SPHI|nr:SGNH/GDSL hydrolase family protein [Sphingobacterium composti Yoo et al. 2007 non Ten et al. 2007]TYP96018.1 GDSL-like lipase/acylhydrolase family protein [Sphingobacterium composti Yoo et al. 2007 non Ten et al. 2007]
MNKVFNDIKVYIGIISIVLASSCKPEIEGFQTSSGQADFSKYVAVGNSLTAGYADGGLYLEGQQVAYPNLLAGQLKNVGGGEFRSPFFSEEQRNGSGYLQLKALENGQPVLENVTSNLAYRAEGKLTKYTGEIENLGVPGMRLDLSAFAEFGALNMYFERLLPDAEVGTKTYMEFAAQRNHTFFTFWLGNNDVLGYAMNGAVEVPGDPTKTLTAVGTFSAVYNNFINALTANQQKGVVATIPDVTAIPYFTTVTRAALLAAVNAGGANVSDIYIQTGAGTTRAATDTDLFVLPFSSAGLLGRPSQGNPVPYGLAPQNPVESKYVLDPAEVQLIKARVNEFNKIIKEVAQAKGLAVADAHAYLNRVKSPGIVYNGMSINAAFITGNAFSLDGVHLTPIGNALMANLFIEAINAQYKSRIQKVDVTQYRGVKFP